MGQNAAFIFECGFLVNVDGSGIFFIKYFSNVYSTAKNMNKNYLKDKTAFYCKDLTGNQTRMNIYKMTAITWPLAQILSKNFNQ